MVKIKFIFPQNYNFKNKLFGFLDYSTVLVNIFWGFFIFLILKLFNLSFNLKLSFFITFYLPLFLFSILGFNNENIIYFIKYTFKFIKNRKVYFYNK